MEGRGERKEPPNTLNILDHRVQPRAPPIPLLPLSSVLIAESWSSIIRGVFLSSTYFLLNTGIFVLHKDLESYFAKFILLSLFC